MAHVPALRTEPAGAAPADRRGREPQPRVVSVAAALLAGSAVWLGSQYGLRQAALFLVGAGAGLVLCHASFGFAAAFRAFAIADDGRGLRAQLTMLALGTILFAPMLASGAVLGQRVTGAVAPPSVAVLLGAFVFGLGMQLGGG